MTSPKRRPQYSTTSNELVSLLVKTMQRQDVVDRKLGNPPVESLGNWKVATKINGWGNYSDYQPLRYARDNSGMVHINGVVSAGTGVVFTLPSAYRPDSERYGFLVTTGTGISAFRISTNGNVNVELGGGATNAIVGMNISFLQNSATKGMGLNWQNGTDGTVPNNPTLHGQPKLFEHRNGMMFPVGLLSGGSNNVGTLLFNYDGRFQASGTDIAMTYGAGAVETRIDFAGGAAVYRGGNNIGVVPLNNLYFAGARTERSWIDAPLAFGRTVYGSYYATPSYYRDRMGWVFLRGLTDGAALNAGDTFINLPVGYRPPATVIFRVPEQGTGADTDSRLIRVEPDGRVRAHEAISGWLSLENVHFFSTGTPASPAPPPETWVI